MPPIAPPPLHPAPAPPSLLRLVWPWRTTAAQSRSLLRLIAVATEERLPLSPLLEAWAADERGVQRGRVARLARLLKAGRPLPEAVEEVPGALRDEDVLAIRFGVQSGTLAGAVRDSLDESMRGKDETRQAPNALIYFCAVLAIGSSIIAFLHIKILPSIVRDSAGLRRRPAARPQTRDRAE